MKSDSLKPSDPVAIVGGGLTGLALCVALSRAGAPVALFERGESLGGHIGSVREDGFLTERGPHTLLLPRREPWNFIKSLGLAERVQLPERAAKKRYIVRGGVPCALPSSPLAFLRSPLFSARAKLRLAAEPFIGRARNANETVSEFVSRRLGREFYEYALDPFVRGVYAGDARELCLRWAFPRMRALEDEHRSLVLGAVKRKLASLGKKDAWKTKTFSFPDGLQTLIDTLAAALPAGAARTSVHFEAIERLEGGGWRLRYRENGGAPAELRARALALAVPAHALEGLPLPPEVRAMLAPISGVVYAPVAVWHQGFRREDVSHPLDGFGALVPSSEPFGILGTLFTSSTFAGRAPNGKVLLTTYMGGRGRPELAFESERAQREILARDLRKLFGVRASPVYERRYVYPHAIAQYRANHGEYVDACERAQSRFPGLFLCGNYRDGIAAYAALARGIDFSRAILKTLAR